MAMTWHSIQPVHDRCLECRDTQRQRLSRREGWERQHRYSASWWCRLVMYKTKGPIYSSCRAQIIFHSFDSCVCVEVTSVPSLFRLVEYRRGKARYQFTSCCHCSSNRASSSLTRWLPISIGGGTATCARNHSQLRITTVADTATRMSPENHIWGLSGGLRPMI